MSRDAARAEELERTVMQQQKELEEVRREYSRMQDRLCKAKNLMLLVQKQADDARIERDRERVRAESLQKSSTQLLRQLKRETAKVHLLERQLASVPRAAAAPATAGPGTAPTAPGGADWGRSGGTAATSAAEEALNDAIACVSMGGSEGPAHRSTAEPATTSLLSLSQAWELDATQVNGLDGSLGHSVHSVNGHMSQDRMEADDVDELLDSLVETAVPGGGPAELSTASQLVPSPLPPVSPKGAGTGAGGATLTNGSLGLKAMVQRSAPPRGKAAEAEFPADGEEDNEQRSWEFVVQGQHDSSAKPQRDFVGKVVSCFPDDAVERASKRGVVFVCSRGRRLDSSVPNQDDFVAARHTLVHGGHIALYGVLDGHGPAGHHCAAFARGALPESLFGQRTLLLKPEDTLREAFRQTQASLLEQPFDTEHSGTTVVLALVLSLPAAPSCEDDASNTVANGARQHRGEAWLFVAHVGDSRAILASHRGGDPSAFTVTALTRDHRPDDPEEAERIRQHGGEIRKLRKTSGAVRVFAQGQDGPGLALTRSLGASASACCGVVAEPEVSAYRLRPGVDVLLLLGTDGLFEFCSNMTAAGQLLRDGVSAATLEDLCHQSRERWAKSSYNETVDDITAIAAVLPSEGLADR